MKVGDYCIDQPVAGMKHCDPIPPTGTNDMFASVEQLSCQSVVRRTGLKYHCVALT